MSQLMIDTVSAPQELGDSTLVPAAEALGHIADQIDEMTILAGVFGDDESGAALVTEYTRVQAETSGRVSADEEAITSAATALTTITTNYQAMLEANTPRGQ